VEVDDVESVRHSQHLLDHDEVRRELIDAVGIEPQGLRNDRHELGSRAGISACEERDLVSLMNEFFGQVGHDPLGAAIVFRWNGLIEGRDLCDLHERSPFLACRRTQCSFRAAVA